MLVFDVTKLESFKGLQYWLKEIKLVNQNYLTYHTVCVVCIEPPITWSQYCTAHKCHVVYLKFD